MAAPDKLTERECVAAMWLALDCLSLNTDQDPDPTSFVGEYVWRNGAINANVTSDPTATLITREVAMLTAELLKLSALRAAYRGVAARV